MNLIAIFALSMSVFSFQTLLSPTFSTIFAGASLHLILAPAWLAFATGFVIWSFLSQKIRTRLTSTSGPLILFCGLTVVSILLSFLLIKIQQNELSQSILSQVGNKTARANEQNLYRSYQNYLLPTAFAATLPFLFYSLFLSTLLSQVSRSKIGTFFAAEFSGITVGMILSAVILDLSGSWVFAVCFSFLSGLWALSCLWPGYSPRSRLSKNSVFKFFGVIVVGIAGCVLVSNLEPEMPLNINARDFSFSHNVTETRKSWNSFSKVQTLSVETLTQVDKMISLGNGTGTARLPKIDEQLSAIPLLTTVRISLSLNPKKVLVLFAGAGAELPSFEKYSPQPIEVTGVELNPAVIRHALLEKEQGLENYLRRPHVSLLNMDARMFLEKTSKNYDVILFSWAGATIAHYSGAIVHTTQFVLTKESLAKAIEHLTPDGSLVIMPGSKFNILASLRELQHEGKIKDLSKQIALLAFNNNPEWRRIWDDNVLIFKNSALTQTDLNSLRQTAEALDAKVVVQPEGPAGPDFEWQKKFLSSDNPSAVLNEVDQKYKILYGSFNDDRPFVYSFVNSSIGFDLDSLWNAVSHFHWKEIFIQRTLFTTALTVLSVALFLIFVVMGWKVAPARVFGLNVSAYGLGIATTGLQLAFTYRLLLFLGNPTYALVLSTLIWMGGSALASSSLSKIRWNRKNFLVALFFSVVIYLVDIYLTNTLAVKEFLFGCDFVWRILLIIVFALPAVFGSGLIFPLLLRTGQPLGGNFIHRLTGLDALTAAVGVLAVPMFIENFGITHVAVGLLVILALSGFSFALSNNFENHV